MDGIAKIITYNIKIPILQNLHYYIFKYITINLNTFNETLKIFLLLMF